MKMKNFTIIFLSSSILCASTVWAQDRYVRKTQEPDFFIPESAKEKPEKLPEFPLIEYYKQQQATEEQRARIENINEIYDEDEWKYDDTPSNEEEKIYTDYWGLSNSYYLSMVQDDGLGQTPEYRNKYNEYLDDLEVIAETNIAPQNLNLIKDLIKMDSNEQVAVDENFDKDDDWDY